MKVGHIALWTRKMDEQSAFWATYFNAQIGEEYVSRNRPGFVSRFVTLTSGPTIELMSLPELGDAPDNKEVVGWAHIAITVGDEADVDQLAQQAKDAGLLRSLPRHTGDGFYEAVLNDPDGNLIEIIAEQ